MNLHQTLPDQFYYMFFFWGFISLMIGARAWYAALLFADQVSPFPQGTQRQRIGFSLLGFLSSGGAILFFLIRYGAHLTVVGLNQMYGVTAFGGILLWAIMVSELVTVVGMLYFLQWFYHHPVAQYVWA